MKYRRDIDGLRAVAVIPVILFHAGFEIFSGGYVGVDVFFVISGYLITCILLDELERGDFSLARFYERRARRILPALFVVMLACLPFAYMWMLPTQLKDFAQSVVAVIFFASNFLFYREDGYFAASAELKPLLHTWSLAVEEQYYLIFPVFLLLIWRFGRSRVFWSIVGLAAASFLMSEWGWRNKPSSNFYLAPTRAWELLAGSICAFLSVGRTQRSSNTLSTAGLLLIVFSIFYYDASTPFPSVYALAPVVGTALVILFGTTGTWVSRLLSKAPFVGLGLISYSAYLWHQPLFAFARLRSMTEPTPLLMAVLAITAMLLAWATLKYVEQPFRKRTNPFPSTRGRVFALSGGVGAVFLAVGLSGHFGEGFEWRTRGDVDFASLDERLIVNHGLHRDCEDNFNNSPNCFTSHTATVLLWGDSFAMHLAQGIVESEQSVGLQQHTLSSCAPILGVAQVDNWQTEDWANSCMDFNQDVLEWLKNNQQVELVILSSPFSGVLSGKILTDGSDILTGNAMDYVAQRLLETVNLIRKAGAVVIIVSPTPSSGWDNGQCLIRSVFFGVVETICDFALDVETDAYKLLQTVENEVAVYWLNENICAEDVCDVMQDGVFIYRDGGHLSKEGSAYLGVKFDWIKKFKHMAN